jgi:hypothetical protein
MTHLTHEMDVPSSCGPEDADFKAFVGATSLIGGRDAVEEFLASGLRPLGQRFGFLVEMKESPLSKVTLPMPQIDATIREWESGDKFAVHIEKAANKLVGRYNIAEHKAFQGLHHGQINRVFELAGFLCQACPEPVGCKRKIRSPDVVKAPTSNRTSGTRGRGRKSVRTETRTSAQKLALAKPLGQSKKISAKSSRLGIAEKASLKGPSAAGGKPKKTLNLFGDDSSASDDKTVPSSRPDKRARETFVSKQTTKPPLAKGMLD